MKKRFFFAAMALLATTGAFAQGNGIGGITEATNMVTSYFDPGTKLIYAIGAVVGLIGGVKVYSKFSSGDPDTSKTAASWFGACIFLIVAATIMAEYPINKGIGRSPEFKGLKSQYLFIFAGGLLTLFVLFVIMYMAGIDQWVCIGFGVTCASVLVWVTFRLNAKYGEWGLMKLQALRRHPRYIISRKGFLRLICPTPKKRSV